MPPSAHELSIRLAAFAWLADQVGLFGDVLPWAVLAKGFEYEGERVPLLSQQGIFKPRVLRLPISMRTASSDPYHDETGTDGVLRYAYRGTDPWHRDNVGLRTAMQERLPLVYFFGIAEAKYVAAWPVFIVGDDPATRRFTVALDDASHVGSGLSVTAADRSAGGTLAAAAPGCVPGASARRVSVDLRAVPPSTSGASRRGAHHSGHRTRWRACGAEWACALQAPSRGVRPELLDRDAGVRDRSASRNPRRRRRADVVARAEGDARQGDRSSQGTRPLARSGEVGEAMEEVQGGRLGPRECRCLALPIHTKTCILSREEQSASPP